MIAFKFDRIRKILFFVLSIPMFSIGAWAQVAAGGQFTLEQSVVAAGGAVLSGGQFALAGTTGQSIAGQKATSTQFSIYAGFWNAAPQFVPTAASVPVSGRVTTADGRGIRGAQVTLTGASGETQTVRTTAFGYFRFSGVLAGETYVISVSAKRFQFSQPTQVCSILEDTENIVFIADGVKSEEIIK